MLPKILLKILKKDTVSTAKNSVTSKQNAEKKEEINGNRHEETTAKPKIVQAPRLNLILAANLIKRKIVGMEPTRPTIRGLSDTSNKKGRRKLLPNKRQLNLEMKQKTSNAGPALWGNSRREGVFNRGCPYHIR